MRSYETLAPRIYAINKPTFLIRVETHPQRPRILKNHEKESPFNNTEIEEIPYFVLIRGRYYEITYSSFAISDMNRKMVAVIPPPAHPAISLAMRMWYNVFPKKISSQYAINGNPKNSKTLLDPVRVVIYGKDKEPTIPPMQFTEAIHDISALVNGPDKIGVLSEVNIGEAPDVQPV